MSITTSPLKYWPGEPTPGTPRHPARIAGSLRQRLEHALDYEKRKGQYNPYVESMQQLLDEMDAALLLQELEQSAKFLKGEQNAK